jgi:LuxR family transcriptional regulator, maltose regulon positive regulatory protein
VRALELVSLLPSLGVDASEEVMMIRIDQVQSVVAPCHPKQSIEWSKMVSTLPAGAWRATARWVRAVNLFLIGDARAAAEMRRALVEAELAELEGMHANILAILSIVDEIEGRRDSAGELAYRAQEQVGPQRAETVTTTAVVAAAKAAAMARRGEHVVAREALALARRHYGDIEPVATWLNVIGRLALVRACLLLGDVTRGSEVFHELRELRSGDDRSAIDDHIDELDTEPPGRLVRWQVLTTAEFRVLQHLPTNLSLSDIAARLFVSRNTVKCHTASIYRQLGATSRTEAVDIARRAGLVTSE